MIREFGVEAVLVDSWDLRVKADSQLPTQQAFLLSRPGGWGGCALGMSEFRLWGGVQLKLVFTPQNVLLVLMRG